jgi:hypothetical protein
VLNFETPGAFFGQLTARHWALVNALQGQGELAVRELARRVGRDVKDARCGVTSTCEICHRQASTTYASKQSWGCFGVWERRDRQGAKKQVPTPTPTR